MAIKAVELRIGNYFINPDGRIEQFEEYWRGQINPKSYPSCSDIDGWDESKINPILIVEDWLLKLGFKPYKYGESDRQFNGYVASWRSGHIRGCLNSKDAFALLDFKTAHLDIRYVHQLQNIYHALTGEELKIK